MGYGLGRLVRLKCFNQLRQMGACLSKQYICQNGKRMPPLYDACNRLQDAEHFFLRCFKYDHLNLSQPTSMLRITELWDRVDAG